MDESFPRPRCWNLVPPVCSWSTSVRGRTAVVRQTALADWIATRNWAKLEDQWARMVERS
ncbi:hypothetical protein JCM18909_1992 [Cutibacterium acnes JCM 18909]|nr:hypothetical protein JCM18909_1992 [Cutibacterium acnes JCM 18909]